MTATLSVSLLSMVLGGFLFAVGLSQSRRFDITRIPIVPAVGKQFFGGAMVIVGGVVTFYFLMRL